MTCDVCRRANLPGGLRCAYCGAYLPPSFDLMATGDSGTVAPSDAEGPSATSASGGMARTAGLLGGLVLLLMKAKSLIALLQFGKIALTLGSMFAYIGVYSQIYKWKFAVGFAISILIHELGHVYVHWRRGIPATAPMFIPFVGALIFVKKFPENPTIQSESGAGGPVAGALAAFVCLGIYYLTGEQYWLALAAIGFLINLFNLLPFHPMQLDGSHVSQVFSPGVWNAVIVGMLLWALKVPSLALWVFILVAIVMRLTTGNSGRYLLATPMVRARMGAIYLLLCVALSYGTDHTASAIPSQLANAPAVTTTTGAGGTGTETPPESARPTPAPAPTAVSPEEVFIDAEIEPASRTRTIASVIVSGASGALLSILWIILPLWLASVGKWRPAAADARLILSMVGLSLGAIIGGYFLPRTGWLSGSALLTGAFTAAGIAFCHVIYQAVRLRSTYTRPAPAILRTRLLAWAWAGVILVAYYTGSAVLSIALIILLAGFYARHPWMVPALQARLAESLGDSEKALTYLETAIARCPESDVRAEMYHHTARLNLHLDRGADTLAALDAARREEESANVPPPILPPTAPRGIREMPDLDTRIAALTLTGRYEEALTHCEQMLAATGGDPRTTPLATFWVHLRLARMALFRGWHDEAAVQVEWCLKHVSSGAATMNASLRLLLAEAQAAQGRSESEKAEANVVTALKASRESTIRAQAGNVRAQIALAADDRETAAKEAGQAVRVLPGHLACLYWWGRTGNPAMLESLAERFPNDYWGQRAKEALAAEPTPM
jgi:Zn-dependent protease/tetratricopeptide (TPR) repeat protein